MFVKLEIYREQSDDPFDDLWYGNSTSNNIMHAKIFRQIRVLAVPLDKRNGAKKNVTEYHDCARARRMLHDALWLEDCLEKSCDELTISYQPWQEPGDQPKACFHEKNATLLQYLQTMAYNEIRFKIITTIGTRLTSELTIKIFDFALAAEETPLMPKVLERRSMVLSGVSGRGQFVKRDGSIRSQSSEGRSGEDLQESPEASSEESSDESSRISSTHVAQLTFIREAYCCGRLKSLHDSIGFRQGAGNAAEAS
jgi:hypothetical protein